LSISEKGDPSAAPGTALETASSVARRLGRSVRTIERWVKAGILPPPMQVNGRNLHAAGVMPKADDPGSRGLRARRPVADAVPPEVPQSDI